MKNINTKMVKAICPNCGVELVCAMNNPAVKCHWCQTMIPSNLYIETPNMPDLILPFKITKEEAQKHLDEYINKINDKKIKRIIEKSDNKEITPIYLPYMLVDINAHSINHGRTKKHINKNKYLSTIKKTRDFDIIIKDIIIETSKNNSFNAQNSSSDVVNRLKPFDVENSVEFNANYLNGYYSENRELNTTDMDASVRDILKQIVNVELKKTDVYAKEKTEWITNENDIIGTQWTSIYLPVWIYSFCVKENGNNKIYYIAINGRTGKTTDSISKEKIKRKKIPILSLLINIALLSFAFYIMMNDYNTSENNPNAIWFAMLLIGSVCANKHFIKGLVSVYFDKHAPTYPAIEGIEYIQRTLYNLNLKDEYYE